MLDDTRSALPIVGACTLTAGRGSIVGKLARSARRVPPRPSGACSTTTSAAAAEPALSVSLSFNFVLDVVLSLASPPLGPDPFSFGSLCLFRFPFSTLLLQRATRRQLVSLLPRETMCEADRGPGGRSGQRERAYLLTFDELFERRATSRFVVFEREEFWLIFDAW